MTDSMKLLDGELIPIDDADRAMVAALQASPVPIVPRRTWKADIWRRCTDAEADILDGLLKRAPTRVRRMWEDITLLAHDDPDFDLVRRPIVETFGPARAAELLAPSL